MGAGRALPLFAALAVALSGCLTPAALPPPPPPPEVQGILTVAFVDVGQGDATVWQLPDGSIIVYDCGPPASNAGANPVNHYLRSIGLAPGATIWAVIASHGHLDHMGGCEEVLSDYEVEHIYELWYQGSDAPTSYSRWRDNIFHETNATVHTFYETGALAGEQLFHQWDPIALPANATAAGFRAQILWPPPVRVQRWDEIGFYSLVVRWSFGSVDYCTAGDIGQDQEAALAGLITDLNCDVYLVGHHGSKDSSTTPWVGTMAPKVAVVSFGNNTFGHPTSEALCRVQSAGAKVYATQRLGTIQVATDGSSLTVTPNNPEPTNYCAAGATYWPPPPPPGNNTTTHPLAVSASASNAQPCQYTTVTVPVHVARGGAPVSGASVTSTWYYKTSSPTEIGTTDAGGDVALSRYISGAAAGYEVVVEVVAAEGGQSATATTSFTPQAC